LSEDVWSASDTTPEAIDGALRELLHERHAADRTVAPARVLNLVVVVDRAWKGEIANRLERVGRYHASRTVLCAVEEGRTSLDARASMGYDEPTAGSVSVMREQVEIDIGPEHLAALDTIVDPVIVSELSTMLWCPHGHREAIDALRGMIDVMLLDSDAEDLAADGLRDAAELQETAYVVDLAWLRTTPWRERLAASFDPPERLRALNALRGVAVRHRRGSEASALLLAGWLCSRLRWEPEPMQPSSGAGMRGAAHRAAGEANGDGDGDVEILLQPSDQDAPGLAGVTVSCGGGFSLSLDRGPGGLRAREYSGAAERSWRILGASRGEGGILGEGVRQALLRDPTYAPALEAALEMTR
jgi:glucose-6-phosphate dehydrogenase assembly protein OpcA